MPENRRDGNLQTNEIFLDNIQRNSFKNLCTIGLSRDCFTLLKDTALLVTARRAGSRALLTWKEVTLGDHRKELLKEFWSFDDLLTLIDHPSLLLHSGLQLYPQW
jgi:hypothetical protein